MKATGGIAAGWQSPREEGEGEEQIEREDKGFSPNKRHKGFLVLFFHRWDKAFTFRTRSLTFSMAAAILEASPWRCGESNCSKVNTAFCISWKPEQHRNRTHERLGWPPSEDRLGLESREELSPQSPAVRGGEPGQQVLIPLPGLWNQQPRGHGGITKRFGGTYAGPHAYIRIFSPHLFPIIPDLEKKTQGCGTEIPLLHPLVLQLQIDEMRWEPSPTIYLLHLQAWVDINYSAFHPATSHPSFLCKAGKGEGVRLGNRDGSDSCTWIQSSGVCSYLECC